MNNELDRQFCSAHSENEEWSRQFSIVSDHQNAGMKAEKRGDLPTAIAEYKSAISCGRKLNKISVNNYYHSYHRLVTILRKQKDYNEEILIINQALSEDLYDKDLDFMSKRLIKAETLRGKNLK